MLPFSRFRTVLPKISLAVFFLSFFSLPASAQDLPAGVETMIRLRQQEQLAQQQRQNAEAQNRCCKCVRREESFCTRLTSVVSCDAFRGGPQYAQLSSAQTQLLENFTCTEIPSAACDAYAGPMVAIPASPAPAAPTTPAQPATSEAAAPAQVCQRTFPSLGEAVATINGATSTSEVVGPTTPEFESITPILGVDIPGLSFSPARKEDGLVYVPFLAQYIAAVQRYAVGLAVVAAIIMVVYGGFLYLLGSSIQDVSTGKTIIANALTGMIIALSGYFILYTVNPNVVTLPEIKLGYINPAYWGENQGAYSTTQAGTSPCRCAPIPSEVNEARVLPVPCYNQAAGAWGPMAYGPNLLLAGESVPRNLQEAVGKPACDGRQSNACVGTFQQGACGPTSLAVVLGYYNAMSREGSPVTPIEAARYLIRAGLRPFNEGTRGICSPQFTENFPGFTCENLSGIPSLAGLQRIIQEIRAGHPVIFHCNKCRVRKADGRIMAGTGSGHFMVFTGVSEDGNILSVHDVGWGPPDGAVAMTAADVANPHSFSAIGLHDGVMKTYVNASVTEAYLVKPIDPTRLPTSNSCQGRARRNTTRSSSDGKILRIPFTYCPRGTCDGTLYKQNEASIIVDSSWLKQPNPAFRVFLYIHGLNFGGTGESGSSKWKRILADYPGAANTPILIIRPHNYGRTNDTLFQNMNAQEVLTQALQALRNYSVHQGSTQTIGSFTVRDITITAHSSGICGGHFARAAQQSYSYNGQSVPIRGLVAFDAYGDCSLDRPSFVNPTGVAYIINTDIGNHGMGRVGSGSFAPTVASRHGMTGGSVERTECPAYAREDGVARCWTKTQSTSNNGYPAANNGWTLFETTLGHDPSVDRVAGYAMRAFYGSGN